MVSEAYLFKSAACNTSVSRSWNGYCDCNWDADRVRRHLLYDARGTFVQQFCTITSSDPPLAIQVEEKRTPLQLSMDELAKKLSLFSFGVIGIICIIGVLQSRSWLEMFTIGGTSSLTAQDEGAHCCF